MEHLKNRDGCILQTANPGDIVHPTFKQSELGIIISRDDFVFAYNNLGCALWAIGKYSDAIRKFQEATDRSPSYADAYFNSGVAYFFLGRYDEAYNKFQLTLDVKPEFQEARNYLEQIKVILKYNP